MLVCAHLFNDFVRSGYSCSVIEANRRPSTDEYSRTHGWATLRLDKYSVTKHGAVVHGII